MSDEQPEGQHDVSEETEEERNERLAQQAKERSAERKQHEEQTGDEFARITATGKKFVYVDAVGDEHEYVLSPVTALDMRHFREEHGVGAVRALENQPDDTAELTNDEWEERQEYMWTLMHYIFRKQQPDIGKDQIMEMFPLQELATGGVVDKIIRAMMPSGEEELTGNAPDEVGG